MTKKYDGLNIHQRLHKIMQDVDYIQKEDKKVNNQYTFVSHDAVTAKCRKAFIENGVITVPTIVSHDKEWCVRKKDGKETTILLTTVQVKIDFINIDEPKEIVSTTSFGYGLDDQDKGLGKAYSYAVKYGYLKALGLETGDDPERELHQEVAPIAKATSMAYDDEQNQQAYDHVLKTIVGFSTTDQLETYWKKEKNKINKLPKALFDDVVESFSQRKTEINAQHMNGSAF